MICMSQAEGATTLYNCLSDFSDWQEGEDLGCEASYNGGSEGSSCMVSNKKDGIALLLRRINNCSKGTREAGYLHTAD